MPHLSEELNIAATPEAVWRIVSDTKRWPQFYATPKTVGRLHCVEYLDGATEDGPEVKRRLHFWGVPAWEEQITRWVPNDSIHWLGTRNPGQKYWQQQLEIIPGKGYVTLRWDIFYDLTSAPRALKKGFKHAMEELMVASLARIDKLARDEAKA